MVEQLVNSWVLNSHCNIVNPASLVVSQVLDSSPYCETQGHYCESIITPVPRGIVHQLASFHTYYTIHLYADDEQCWLFTHYYYTVHPVLLPLLLLLLLIFHFYLLVTVYLQPWLWGQVDTAIWILEKAPTSATLANADGMSPLHIIAARTQRAWRAGWVTAGQVLNDISYCCMRQEASNFWP